MVTSSPSNTAESASVFNIADPKSTLLSLNMSCITKLTPTNFLTWRLQVSAFLEAHDLHVFIANDANIPAQTVTGTNGNAEPNPNFKAWQRQDKLLYSSLIGTLSMQVQPLVTRATTSREIWQTLTRTYGNPSRGHINQIRDQLKTCTKGNQSIHDYLQSIIIKTDQLALLGSPMTHEDILDKVTSGLGDDYRAIIEMVAGRDTPISLEELHEKLINRENALNATANTTYWTYSFAAAVYLINRLTTPNLAHCSPYHLLFQVKPNYEKLRTFGCLCYPWLRPYGQNKFSPKSVPCVFLGYSLSQSAFLCLDVETSRIYVTRHVEFHESVFPFPNLSATNNQSPP